MQKYVDLHCHSQHSILDGVGQVADIVKKAKSMGHTAVAISDHGNCNAWISLHDECKSEGLKPVYGCEFYFAKGNAKEKVKDQKHLILHAKNKIGYHNILRLNAFAQGPGFYYKPRIDFKRLQKYSEGVICLSGCGSGIVPSLIGKDNYDEALEWAKKFKNLFGDDYYLEMQVSDFKGQDIINKGLIKMSKQLGIKLVTTTDAHYVNKEDAILQDVMMLIGQKKTWADRDKAIEAFSRGEKVKLPWEIHTKQLWMKSSDELERARAKWHSYMPAELLIQSLKNTIEIENKIEHWQLDASPKYPVMDTGNKTSAQVLREWIVEGFKFRKIDKKNIDKYTERSDYEFNILKEKGLEAYFVILADAIREARKIGIFTGVGRGSAAGSLVCYLLGITGADPMKHDLMFERFINPGRKEMPDIDVDFPSSRRDEVKQYLMTKYGVDHVAEVAAFQNMKFKSSLKDVGRVMGGNYGATNKFTARIDDKKIKAMDEERMNIEDSIELLKEVYPKELQEYLGADESHERILNIALRLKGKIRNISKHPAGVVITPKPLADCLALQRRGNGMLVGWTEGTYRKELTSQGFVKYDILAIKTLDIIYSAVEMIKKRHGVDIDIDTIDLNDQKVYEQTKKGRSLGSFQFETPIMQKMLQDMKADRFEDLAVLNALDRPGPLDMGMDKIYNKLKRGEEDDETREAVKPVMKLILPATYGVIVFQEQVLKTAQKLANFTLDKADKLRKALMKKEKDQTKEDIRKKMVQQLKEEFIDQASKNDYKP